MKKNQIDFSTQLKIKKHMNFLWKNEVNKPSNAANEILNKFTPNLKKEFLSQTLGNLLFAIPLFQRNFSREFLEELLLFIKIVNFDDNSFIYKVFFLKKLK